MRKFIAVLLLTGLMCPYGAVAQSPTVPLATFPREQQAQQNCPADTVVWLITVSSSGIALGSNFHNLTILI